MNINSFSWAQNFVASHGYAFIFLVMVIEGPMITTAAAFAASLGYFNVWIIFMLSIAGDVVGDILHFWIGRKIRTRFVERYGHYVGLSKERIVKLEARLKKNLGKTMIAMKMSPIAGIAILLAGALQAPWGEFLLYSVFITIPRAIFFVSLGFFFGWAITTVLKYFKWGEYAFGAILIVVAIAYLIIRHLGKRYSEI